MEIVCWALYPDIDKLIEAVPKMADEGVTAIEIDLNSSICADNRDAQGIDKLINCLSRAGVRAYSVHAPFDPLSDISSPDDSVHEHGVEGLIGSIEIASILGAERIVVHAGSIVTNGHSQQLERARGVLREVGVIAREAGAILALENLPPQYVGHTPEEIHGLLDGTDAESVALCFDCGHANMSGKFEEYMDALLPKAVIAHVHDNDGGDDQHRFPGQGNINWQRFAEAYQATNRKATIVLECRPPENMLWSEAFHRLRLALG